MSKAMRHTETRLTGPRDVARLAMCAGKDPLTWAQAKGIIERTQNKGRKITAYHCRICRAWHVGHHMPGKGSRRAKGARPWSK